MLTSRIFYDIYEIFLEKDVVLEDARGGWWVSFQFGLYHHCL